MGPAFCHMFKDRAGGRAKEGKIGSGVGGFRGMVPQKVQSKPHILTSLYV